MRGFISKDHQLAGQGAVLATAFFWSTSGLFIKLLDFHPVVIAGSRSFVAAIFILIVRLLSPVPKSTKNNPLALWGGGISYALTMITFVIANKLTSSANAIMLQYSAPVWAALLGWLFIREKPHWEHWFALLMVMGGLTLFLQGGLGSGTLLGDGIAVFSGILFGAHSVFLRMMKDGSPRDAMLLAHVLCAGASIPFVFLYPPDLTLTSVLPVLFMGIFQVGLASLLFSYGIKRISAVQAMLTAIVEPVFNPLWVLLVTGEKPSLIALAGGAIILAAIVSSSLIGKYRVDRKYRAARIQ